MHRDIAMRYNKLKAKVLERKTDFEALTGFLESETIGSKHPPALDFILMKKEGC